MVLSNPINIASATMEQIYERMCWIYSALRLTFVYKAIGNSYPPSEITQPTRAKTRYPERFNEMIDYQQNAFIQDLEMKDVLCTKGDWMQHGRNYFTMPDLHDSEGHELYISMEGIPLREPEVTATQIIRQLKIFPIYLRGASNTMMGELILNAFEVIAPPGRVTVFCVHELQRSEAECETASPWPRPAQN